MEKHLFERFESLVSSHQVFESLELAHRDSLDFTNVSKGQLLALLKEAYEMGISDGSCSCGV